MGPRPPGKAQDPPAWNGRGVTSGLARWVTQTPSINHPGCPVISFWSLAVAGRPRESRLATLDCMLLLRGVMRAVSLCHTLSPPQHHFPHSPPPPCHGLLVTDLVPRTEMVPSQSAKGLLHGPAAVRQEEPVPSSCCEENATNGVALKKK